MKKIAAILLLVIAPVMAWLGCKKAYAPKIVATATHYLVVEAVINTGSDPTVIRLSRTVPLSTPGNGTPETGAVITILSDAGATYPVVEQGNGIYQGAPINATGQAKYCLKITTSNGVNYQSDFVEAKNSPPIDSVYYKIQGNGLDIYADTHDPSNSSRYYRWGYTDTYIFTSAYNSTGYYSKVPKDTVLFRPVADQIHQCWHNDTSSSYLLSSSAKLTNDIITDNKILSLPSTSEKIARRFSINVSQFVLTPDAYSYYEQLKKNTELIGSIFDPQPSELPGNVHCITNPAEIVIGYITAGVPAQKRIFIDTHNLPPWVADNPYQECELDTFLYARPLLHSDPVNEIAETIYPGLYDPVSAVGPPGGDPAGWSASSPFCVDCTLRGTNVRPIFWTDY